MKKVTIDIEKLLRMNCSCITLRRTKEPGYEMMSYVDQELTVEDMLADPIVQTLMRYDGVSASDVRHTIEQVNQNRPEDAVDSTDARIPKTPAMSSGIARPRLHETAA